MHARRLYAFVLFSGLVRSSPIALGVPPESGQGVAESGWRFGGHTEAFSPLVLLSEVVCEAKARKEQAQPSANSKGTKMPTKRTMSAVARRKIAAFQRARWAKVRAQQKKAP
jgi:hypothetical protein